MMNFEKYRKLDTVKLEGIIGDVYKQNEDGELINPIMCKDADWITGKSFNIKAEEFDFEKFVLENLNSRFINDLKPEDICICGSYLSFWKREDADGIEDEKGKFFVSYCVTIKLNGQNVEESDMIEMFPHFEY